MILRFSKDLKKLDVYANGNELVNIMGENIDEKGNRIRSAPETAEKFVATINNPVLVTDTHQWEKFDSTTRETLHSLYASKIRITEYDGTTIRFEQGKYPGVWGHQ